MDPQQRLALELGWEALEDAGIAPDSVGGTPAGVYVGAISDDYATLLRRNGPQGITRHMFTGIQRGVIANRLSYSLGLRGPSMTVDCGQSSSLVAVHLAVDSLRRGESSLVLAGGVHLNLAPESTLAVERFGGLSPTPAASPSTRAPTASSAARAARSSSSSPSPGPWPTATASTASSTVRPSTTTARARPWRSRTPTPSAR